jgi:hypothetical protein
MRVRLPRRRDCNQGRNRRGETDSSPGESLARYLEDERVNQHGWKPEPGVSLSPCRWLQGAGPGDLRLRSLHGEGGIPLSLPSHARECGHCLLNTTTPRTCPAPTRCTTMESAYLTQAHDHARNAATATAGTSVATAGQEHHLAATAFRDATQDTANVEVRMMTWSLIRYLTLHRPCAYSPSSKTTTASSPA